MEYWKTFLDWFNAVAGAVQASTPLLIFLAGLILGKVMKSLPQLENWMIPAVLAFLGLFTGGVLLPMQHTFVEITKGCLFGMSLTLASVGTNQVWKQWRLRGAVPPVPSTPPSLQPIAKI